MSTNAIESITHTRWIAVDLVDAMQKALRTSEAFPSPVGTITLEVVGRVAPNPLAFDPPLRLHSIVNSGGFLLVDGTYTRPARSEARVPLGDGDYTVRVQGERYRTSAFVMHWPPAPDTHRVPLDANQRPRPLALLPGAFYPLPDVTSSRFQLGPTIIRGTFYDPSGSPLKGVRVRAQIQWQQPADVPPLPAEWPFLEGQSDDRGDWLLLLPSRRYFTASPEILPLNQAEVFRVVLQFPNGPFANLPIDVTLGTEHSVRNTGLRGQVRDRSGRPIEGAVITTSLGPLRSTSRNDGVWFLYFDLAQPNVNQLTVTARTPDGATVSDPNVRIEHGRTLVVPTFHVP